MSKKWLPSLIGLSILAMLGRLLGFVREMLIASGFGATDITDSYLTALILFDIAMAANASFLQGAFAYSAEAKPEKNFEAGLLSLGLKIFAVITAAAAVYYFFAGDIIQLFYSRSPEATGTIINSTRLFFFLSSFLAAGGIFSALLQMKGHITNPGRLIVFLNVSSILFLIAFKGNAGIIAIPMGFLIGGILFFAYQLMLIRKTGLGVKFSSGVKLHGWGAIFILIFVNSLFPSILGLLERYFAYSFTEGAFSHYQYAQKILQLPLTILSFAISASLLPMQVKSVKDGKEEEFASAALNGIKISVVTSAFFALAFFILAEPVIEIIYMRGNFNHADMIETSSALRLLSLGLIPYLLTPVVANIYLSKKGTKRLIAINLIFAAVQILSLSVLTRYYPGIKSLSINWIAMAWLNNIALLLYAVYRKDFRFPSSEGIKIFLIVAGTSLAAAGAYFLLPSFGNVWINLIVNGVLLFAVYSVIVVLIFRNDLSALLKSLRKI